MKIITVFGSSFPRPGDAEYEKAYELGKLIGTGGFGVCTGGYNGIMDAVSKGTVEAGSEATGITVNHFKAKPSAYLTEEIKTNSLMERLKLLIEKGDGYIILPGGTGTLVELALIWEYMNKKIMHVKPAAAAGSMWNGLLESIEARQNLEGRPNEIIKLFDNPLQAGEFVISELA